MSELGFWPSLVLAGFAGFGLGIGLVAGAYAVHYFRQWGREDDR